jgi:ribonuclease HI
MKITGQFYGYASKDKAAFGIWLKSGDQEYIKTIKLNKATTNLAELYALEYALKAIKDNKPEIELESCNSYVPRLMEKNEKGNYKAKAERNIDLVERTRKAADPFTNLKVTIGKATTMKALQEMVKAEAK